MRELVSLYRLYGKGVFTTIAIYGGEPFLWEKHWQRLSSHAKNLGIDTSEYDEQSAANAVFDLIKKDQVINGRARITIFDESPSEIWSDGGEKKAGLTIITAGPRTIPKSFKLTVSPYSVNTTSPLAGIKSCNYLEHLMAYDEARNRAFDEAIRLNERGAIASGCMSNIFWLKGGTLYTPSLKTGCLAGTTREFVLENLECEEVEAEVDAVRHADAIFLTSAGLGVVRVAEIEGRKLRTVEHAINSLLPKPLATNLH